jgi:hypothetical protein
MEQKTPSRFTRRPYILIKFGSDAVCHTALGLAAIFSENMADRNELRHSTHQFMVSLDNDEGCCLLIPTILLNHPVEGDGSLKPAT